MCLDCWHSSWKGKHLGTVAPRLSWSLIDLIFFPLTAGWEAAFAEIHTYYLVHDYVSKLGASDAMQISEGGVDFHQVPGLSGWTGVGVSSIKRAFHVETLTQSLKAILFYTGTLWELSVNFLLLSRMEYLPVQRFSGWMFWTATTLSLTELLLQPRLGAGMISPCLALMILPYSPFFSRKAAIKLPLPGC